MIPTSGARFIRCSSQIRQKVTLPNLPQSRHSSTNNSSDEDGAKKNEAKPQESSAPEVKIKKKTQAQLDQELQDKMAGIAGDGGDAGLELEGGKAVSMKRSVRENMFRYI